MKSGSGPVHGNGVGDKDGNCHSVIRGECRFQPYMYMVSERLRSLYMCPAETVMTEQLTDLIETWDRANGGLCFVDPDGSMCAGVVAGENGKDVTCEAMKVIGVRILPRKVTLFTLNHDIPSIVLKDWVCSSC